MRHNSKIIAFGFCFLLAASCSNQRQSCSDGENTQLSKPEKQEQLEFANSDKSISTK